MSLWKFYDDMACSLITTGRLTLENSNGDEDNDNKTSERGQNITILKLALAFGSYVLITVRVIYCNWRKTFRGRKMMNQTDQCLASVLLT